MEISGMEFTPDMYWAMALVVIASLAIRAFYCVTLYKTLKLIDEENRHMQSIQVWFAMIPIFTIYWNFKIAESMANSLTNEFYDRQIAEEENPGRATGYSYSLLFALGYIPIAPGFVFIMGLFSFIFFIRYWVKISKFKLILEEHNKIFNSNGTKEAGNEA